MELAPSEPSSTSHFSCGAPAWAFVVTRTTLRSSSRRCALVCRRPAVSRMTRSAPRATPALTASNATAAGSAPAAPPTTSTPSRPAQAESCSPAAARKVSQAPSRQVLPSSRQRQASFAAVVVLPAPLTPRSMITCGFEGTGATAVSPPSARTMLSAAASAGEVLRSEASVFHAARAASTTSSAVAGPKSAAISRSRSCSADAASIGRARRLATASAVRLRPDFSRSKKPAMAQPPSALRGSRPSSSL